MALASNKDGLPAIATAAGGISTFYATNLCSRNMFYPMSRGTSASTKSNFSSLNVPSGVGFRNGTYLMLIEILSPNQKL